MADIINLRQARKARDRSVAQDKAAANRVIHGRTKAEKATAMADAVRMGRVLDGAKRDTESTD